MIKLIVPALTVRKISDRETIPFCTFNNSDYSNSVEFIGIYLKGISSKLKIIHLNLGEFLRFKVKSNKSKRTEQNVREFDEI